MQGASQAMEDGVTLAICLRHAGKQNIPLALKIYERIRYDRVRRVQKMGESTRDQWHKADWDAVMKDPTLVQLPYPDYILKFNSHVFAEENYERVAAEVRQGRTLRDFDDEEHLKKVTKNSVDEVQMTPAAL
jgi:2-polyprenyl-6-methoxyphenol hydroxylase-like FAD-dependent oxidoreductase